MAIFKKQTDSFFATHPLFPFSPPVILTFLWVMAIPATAFPQDVASVLVTLPINSSSSQIYGIFAGMADYPGEENDLEQTDYDALRTRDALLEGAGMEP